MPARSVDPHGFPAWCASRMNDSTVPHRRGHDDLGIEHTGGLATTTLAATFRGNAGAQYDRSLAREVLNGGAAAISNHAIRGPPDRRGARPDPNGNERHRGGRNGSDATTLNVSAETPPSHLAPHGGP